MLQVYTGDGKGKTTAAVGLVVRAVGAGLRCYVGQFLKDEPSSEIRVLQGLPDVQTECFGAGGGCLIGRERTASDAECAQRGVRRVIAALRSGRYDVVVADELNCVCALGLISTDDWLACANARPQNVELVCTGRGAPACAIDKADLVTEMREVKHYYRRGVQARLGIEK